MDRRNVGRVEDLSIALGGDVVFYLPHKPRSLKSGTKHHVTNPGEFGFSSIIIMRNGRAEFQKINKAVKINAGLVKVQYQAEMFVYHAVVDSGYGVLESEGLLYMDNSGHAAEFGVGAGRTTSSNTGSGGGHGGQGGGPSPNFGGAAYDSIYTPAQLGSGGGNAGTVKGGAGGGYLHWKVGKLLELNGILRASGGNALGPNAGGGSGGSILIETTNVTGHGEINVRGGLGGSGSGYGGAGGRIAVKCRWRYQYGGKFINAGGLGGSSSLLLAAAAGTTYKEENMRPPQYRELKYNPSKNQTYLKVDHTYIHADNEGNDVPPATVIMEENTFYYEFDEAELTGYARLIFYHPDSEMHKAVNINFSET
ncbi:uncharacterized protein LOC144746995 isoform X2 [Ciona intestinalis]